jgi:hypothetical protein
MTRVSPISKKKDIPKLRREMMEEKSPRLLNPKPLPPNMEMTEKSSLLRVINGDQEKEAVGDKIKSPPLSIKTNH